jgi:putative ABC transport system permease protein
MYITKKDRVTNSPPLWGWLGWGSLPWRNLWRNKRRTLITIASVAFAVFFAVLLRGYHGGMWAYMIENVVHSYTGYVQVHTNKFWSERTLDYSMEWSDSLKNTILTDKDVSDVIPRIESFALASTERKTKGVLVIGIIPSLEEKFSNLPKKIKSGEMFSDSDKAAIVSQRLAKFLQLQVGDTLVLISQGYQGLSAAGLFPVKAIVKLPAPEFDNQTVYLPLKAAQDFYSLNGRLTSLVIDLKRSKDMSKVAISLKNKLDPSRYEVMTWHEMLRELYQQYISDEGGGKILLGLLYLIIGFGIFGTVMMMTAERKREFGVMISIGMKRHRLVFMIACEMFLIAVIGVIIGMAGSVPVITWFHFHPLRFSQEFAQVFEAFGMEPIISVLWEAGYIINQGIIVFTLTLLVIIYPIYSVGKLSVIKALRS